MARIPTYQKDVNISDLDSFLGTDGDSNELTTKNFCLGDVANYVIDKLIDPDAADFQIPVFNQSGNRITGSIMSQDSSPSNGVAGTKITINGNLQLGQYKYLTFGDITDSDNLKIENINGLGASVKQSGPGILGIYGESEVLIASIGPNGLGQENLARFKEDGPVELYYNNNKKFETTSTGITVTGTQSSFTGQVTIPETPVAGTDAASKAYVDAQSSGGNVSGTGTTNTVPIWADGPNGILSDSSISQVLDAGNNVKQIDIVTASGQSAKYSFNGAATKFSMYNTVGSDLFLLTGDNTGFYQNNFQVRGNLAVGRSSQALGATLDVGAPANTIPSAWFRNGVVISNNPSGVQVDNTSMVIGAGNNDVVSGADNCLAVGNNNQILSDSDNSLVVGQGNIIRNNADNSFAIGQNNIIDGTAAAQSVKSQVLGFQNNLNGSFSSFIAGGQNTVTTNQNAVALGFSHILAGEDSMFAFGENNTGPSGANDNNSFMIGGNLAGVDGNMALGFRNDTSSYPTADYSNGLGNTKFVVSVGTVTTSNAMIITEGGVTRGGGITQVPRIILPQQETLEFTSDADATASGVPTGGLYRNGNDLKINFNETAAGGNEGLAYLTPQLIAGSGPMGGGGFSANVNPNYNLVLLSWSGPNGVFTLNLPLASANTHRLIRITTDGSLDAGAADKINITATGGETIDGNPSFQISKRYEGLAVFSTGSEWIIVQAKAH